MNTSGLDKTQFKQVCAAQLPFKADIPVQNIRKGVPWNGNLETLPLDTALITGIPARREIDAVREGIAQRGHWRQTAVLSRYPRRRSCVDGRAEGRQTSLCRAGPITLAESEARHGLRVQAICGAEPG